MVRGGGTGWHPRSQVHQTACFWLSSLTAMLGVYLLMSSVRQLRPLRRGDRWARFAPWKCPQAWIWEYEFVLSGDGDGRRGGRLSIAPPLVALTHRWGMCRYFSYIFIMVFVVFCERRVCAFVDADEEQGSSPVVHGSDIPGTHGES